MSAISRKTTLISVRQFGEVLAQLVAARSGLLADAIETQADLLRRLRVDGNYPPNVLDLFHQLRIQGNAAWFYLTFDDHNLKAGPFQPPRPPVDATAELKAELDRLKAERDVALTAAERAKAARPQRPRRLFWMLRRGRKEQPTKEYCGNS